MARCTSRSWPRLLSTMTGMAAVAGSALMLRKTSKPWILGMMRSRSTRCGLHVPTARRASSPSVAVITSKPFRLSVVSAALRRNRSSSASRIRYVSPVMVSVAQEPCHVLAQCLQGQVGLHEVAGNFELVDLRVILFARGIGEDKDGHRLGPRVGPEGPENLDARQPRHQEVEEDEIRQGAAPPLELVEGSLAIHGDGDVEAPVAQAGLAGAAQHAIVLHEQDALRLPRHAVSACRGRVNAKVAPSPSTDSHHTRPPSCSMMRRTRYRPSPVPSVSMDVTLSAR